MDGNQKNKGLFQKEALLRFFLLCNLIFFGCAGPTAPKNEVSGSPTPSVSASDDSSSSEGEVEDEIPSETPSPSASGSSTSSTPTPTPTPTPTVALEEPTPTVSFESPGAYITSENVAAFPINGACSEEGLTVYITGAVTSSATCASSSWATTINFTSANQGSLTLYADLDNNSGRHAAQASLHIVKDTIVPAVSITNPADGSSIISTNVTSFLVSGTCTEDGRKVALSGATTALISCTSGTWSANIDFTAALAGALTLQANLRDAAGNRATQASINLTKDVLAPTATLVSPPTGTNRFTGISVTVAGAGVVSYRYKLGSTSSTDCANSADYGSATAISQALSEVGSSIPEEAVTLCVIGKDTAGNWQPFPNATTASFTKDTTPPNPATAPVITRGWQKLTLSWGASITPSTAGYLVVKKASSAPTFTPTDGVSYTANDDLGNSTTVVYSGSEIETIASSLTMGTTYHFKIFAYDASNNYSTSVSTSDLPARWKPMSTLDAPSPRFMVAYAWTGATGNAATANRLIVWGGVKTSTYLNDGAIYDPATDTWTAVSQTNAPSARKYQDATRQTFWTGNTGDAATSNKFIVWGGLVTGGGATNTGAIYDIATNTWTPMSTTSAAGARDIYSSVWTGNTGNVATSGRLLIWGGDTGSNSAVFAYDLKNDSWSAGTTTGAPTFKSRSAGVWTGTQMIVWGGGIPLTNGGGIYDLPGNTWTATTTTSAPTARRWHGAVWTGSTGDASTSDRMFVYGGYDTPDLNTGALFNPANNTWAAIGTTNAPVIGRPVAMTMLDTDRVLLVGGASENYRTPIIYDLGDQSWWIGDGVGGAGFTRYGAWAWTGSTLIVWGGSDSAVGSGAIYHKEW